MLLIKCLWNWDQIDIRIVLEQNPDAVRPAFLFAVDDAVQGRTAFSILGVYVSTFLNKHLLKSKQNIQRPYF